MNALQARLAKARQKPRKGFYALRVIKGIGSAIVLLIGTTALWPRLTVVGGEPSDPSQPFTSIFHVTNTGLLPLDHVHPSLALGKIVFSRENGKTVTLAASTPYKVQFDHDWPTRDLGSDGQLDFVVSDIGLPGFSDNTLRLQEAEIGVSVTYELPWIHLKRTKVFYFVERRFNDTYRWFADDR